MEKKKYSEISGKNNFCLRVVLSASVERFSVSCRRDFLFAKNSKQVLREPKTNLVFTPTFKQALYCE